MKVLAFCDHLSPASSGGAERVATEVYRRMASRPDVRLTVVSVLRPGHRPVDIPGATVVPVAGSDLSGVVGAEMLLARGLGRRVNVLVDEVRPDVLHANGLHFQGSAVAARVARRTGIPLVTTAHLGDLSALPPRLRLAGTVWDATIGAFIVRSSSVLLAVSRAVADHLTHLGAHPRHVRVAANGLDHDVFRAGGRRPLGSEPGLRAVFVGRLVQNKGPAVALEGVAGARRAGRDVHLSVLGDGPLRGRLEAAADELGIGSAVTFHGHVDGIADVLREADVLLRPSFTEGLPLAVLEGMACGLPVVCSTVPGNTEAVVHGESGWHTRPGSPEDVASALVTLADDRLTLRRMGAAAMAAAAGYSWERSAEIHAAALHSVRSATACLLTPGSTVS